MQDCRPLSNHALYFLTYSVALLGRELRRSVEGGNEDIAGGSESS